MYAHIMSNKHRGITLPSIESITNDAESSARMPPISLYQESSSASNSPVQNQQELFPSSPVGFANLSFSQHQDENFPSLAPHASLHQASSSSPASASASASASAFASAPASASASASASVSKRKRNRNKFSHGMKSNPLESMEMRSKKPLNMTIITSSSLSNNSSNGGTPSRQSTPPNGNKVYNTTSKSRSKMSSVYSDKLSVAQDYHGMYNGNLMKCKGPPKTSRFYKSLPENKTDANSSTHHYNPYLYLQHRTRVNPPLDFSMVDTRENVGENYQYRGLEETEVLLNEEFDMSRSLDAGDLLPKEMPVFYMSEDEFRDPLEFTEKIAHIGKRYGAIKVVPPSNWSTTFSLNTELFWFRSRRQLLNNFKSEMDSRLEFYYELFNYHFLVNKKKNAASILNKLPSIDKRILDLYRLRKYVQLRGGFHVVCKKKLWAQIGRELGYSGRIMTSLSSSLKSAYQRVVLDFDEYQSAKELDSADVPNDHGKRQLAADATPRKKAKLQDNIESLDDLPVILGSSVEYKRPRDILRSKGFHTYFNNITEEKKSISKKDKYTLALYNFYDWFNQSLLNVLDTASYDSKLAPLYNLKQFFEKNLKFEQLILKEFAESLGVDTPTEFSSPTVKPKLKGKTADIHSKKETSIGPPPVSALARWSVDPHTLKPDDDKLEQLYWHVVFDKDTLHEVENGMDITSTVHESAFPTVTCPQPMSDCKVKEALDPWNLNNFSINSNSLLRYLDDDDYSGLTRPRLMVGMMFSSECWNAEDHFLHKVSYNHLGSSRVWYAIPPAYQHKYEALVKSVADSRRQSSKDDEDITKEKEISRNQSASVVFDVQNHFSIQEYLNCSMENKVQAVLDNDRFLHQKSILFNKYFNKIRSGLTRFDRIPKTAKTRLKSRAKNMPNLYNQDTFFPPEFLIRNGIPVYKTYQRPGQFIIKFPRAYTSTVSLGFTVGESANYATSSWLDLAFEAEKWLIRQNIVPAFSAIKLLINIAKDKNIAKNDKLKERVKPLFLKLYKTETELRQKFRALFPQVIPKVVTEADVDYKDTISDHNLESCFPSKVILEANDVRFQVSLHNFLQTYESNKKFGKLLDQTNLSLQLYYSDKTLRRIHAVLFANSSDAHEWVQGFKSYMAQHPCPDIADLRQWLADSSVLSEALPEYRLLNKFVNEAHVWLKNAQIVLRGAALGSLLHLDFVQSVLDAIPRLRFRCPEILQLTALADAVALYNLRASAFLAEPGHDINEFEQLLAEGKAFGIDLKVVRVLSRIVRHMKWKDRVLQLAESHNLADIKHLYTQGLELGRPEDAALIAELKNKLDLGQKTDDFVRTVLNGDHVSRAELQQMLDSRQGPLYPETKELINEFFNGHSTVESKVERFHADMLSQAATIEQELLIRRKLELRYQQVSQLAGAGAGAGADMDTDTDGEDGGYPELEDDRAPGVKFILDGFITRDEDSFLHDFSLCFDGGARDQRPRQEEVVEVVCSGDRLEIKGDGLDKLRKEVKRTSEWVSECFQLFVQNNVLKVRSSLSDVLADVAQTNNVVLGIENSSKAACFCRKDDHGALVRCIQCSEYYHESCLKQQYRYHVILDETFVCPVCEPDSVARKFFRPKLQDVLNLYFAGRELWTCPEDLHVLTGIVKQACMFVKQASDDLHMVLDAPEYYVAGNSDPYYKKAAAKHVFRRHPARDANSFEDSAESSVDRLRFVLRKLEGASIDFERETQRVRQRITFLQVHANHTRLVNEESDDLYETPESEDSKLETTKSMGFGSSSILLN